MNNKEKMKTTIKKDFDKKNNYDKIIDKIDNNSSKTYYKYVFVPLLFIIVITIFSITINVDNRTKSLKHDNNINTSSVNQNEDDFDGFNNNENNNIVINEYNGKNTTSSNDVDGKIKNGICIPYFGILSDLEIPKDFDNNGNADTVWVKSDPNSNEYDILNNYNFYYRNTSNNRIIIISLSDKYKPLRCPSDYVLSYPKSVINGHEVLIIKNQNSFISIFSYKGYNFDIESYDITEEEFVNLLSSIIK